MLSNAEPVILSGLAFLSCTEDGMDTQASVLPSTVPSFVPPAVATSIDLIGGMALPIYIVLNSVLLFLFF